MIRPWTIALLLTVLPASAALADVGGMAGTFQVGAQLNASAPMYNLPAICGVLVLMLSAVSAGIWANQRPRR